MIAKTELLNKKSFKSILSLTGTELVLFSVIIISTYPLVWTLLNSFKADPPRDPGFKFPAEWSFKGYKVIFTELNILGYFYNSIKIAAISVFIGLTIITLTAYVVARIDFKGKGFITLLLISTLFLPVTATAIPTFWLVGKLGLMNTHAGIIFVYSAGISVVSFYIIRGYFLTIPKQLEESGYLDGCGFFRAFISLILPLALPGIGTAAIISFMGYWNEFYIATLYLQDRELMTIPALLAQFTLVFTIDYNGLFASVIIIILLPIILFSCFSKFFIQALTAGAVKG